MGARKLIKQPVRPSVCLSVCQSALALGVVQLPSPSTSQEYGVLSSPCTFAARQPMNTLSRRDRRQHSLFFHFPFGWQCGAVVHPWHPRHSHVRQREDGGGMDGTDGTAGQGRTPCIMPRRKEGGKEATSLMGRTGTALHYQFVIVKLCGGVREKLRPSDDHSWSKFQSLVSSLSVRCFTIIPALTFCATDGCCCMLLGWVGLTPSWR